MDVFKKFARDRGGFFEYEALVQYLEQVGIKTGNLRGQLHIGTDSYFLYYSSNEVITKGAMTQFIPYKGIYVIARRYQGKTALTILNGTRQEATMPVERYVEVIGNTKRAKDILTGRYYDLSQDLRLRPRQSLVLEF